MLIHHFVRLAVAAAALFGQSVAATAHCSNPSVRREWRSLTSNQRAEWITAVKCLNTLPHDSSLTPTFNRTYTAIPPINASSSYFDDFVYVHMDLNPIIHFTGLFLPWHRAYVKDFESALREKCGYKGAQPYWNWTLDASNFQDSTLWDPDTTSGLGGWGDPNDDNQITDGGFADDFVVSYPVPNRIRRQYTPSFPNAPDVLLADSFTPEVIAAIVSGFEGSFVGFQALLEWEPHGAVHAIVGGDLIGSCPSNAPASCVSGAKWTPNDPLFILHHGMIDKIWHDWQHTHPSNFWSFTGGSVPMVSGFTVNPEFQNGAPPFVNFSTPIPTDGILNNYTMYELMDTLGERLCYTYE